MVEIVIAVCLINDPARCKDVRLTYMADSYTPMQCMMYGQTEAVKWLEGNPKWQLKRWSCGVPGQIAKI
jgi:hypothetical protein